MEEKDNHDDDSNDGDEEEDGNSKNRTSKEITELYYFVLVLALNQVTTKYDGLRAKEKAAKMVELSLEWTDLIRSDFGMISKKLMGKGGVTEEQLRATINKDTGKNMLKKAKLVVSVINNHLSSYWKEPEESASGKGREGMSLVTFHIVQVCIFEIPLSEVESMVSFTAADNLHTCKEGAWAEKERVRLAAKLKKWKGPEEFIEKANKMPPNWHCPQFLTFVHLALPAGARECRKVFVLTGGSGPAVKGSAKITNKKDKGLKPSCFFLSCKRVQNTLRIFHATLFTFDILESLK